MKKMNLNELQSLLKYYLPSETAYEMAQAILEDMDSIKFIVEEAHFTSPEKWRQLGVIPQAEYILPPNKFDINSATGSEALEGSFLTTGNLLRLGQCVLLGRRFLGDLWPQKFAGRILGQEHLDALNEIWWLKFWRGIKSVSPGPKVSGNDPDFEWQISIRDGLATCGINLEVKRRTSNINKFLKAGRPTASVRKISKKFGAVDESTANIAAITVYHPVSEEIDRELRIWLNDQQNIHGLLLWTEGNFDTSPLRKFFKESHRWAEMLLKDPSPEDLMIAGFAVGTLCEAEDVAEYLANLSTQIHN